MLELGKYSKRLHIKAAQYINNAKIDKVYVYGKDVIETFNKAQKKYPPCPFNTILYLYIISCLKIKKQFPNPAFRGV